MLSHVIICLIEQRVFMCGDMLFLRIFVAVTLNFGCLRLTGRWGKISKC
jgi:hypothetical protein